MIDELKRMLSDCYALIEKLRKEITTLKDQKKLFNKDRFDGKPQKLSSKNRDSDSCEADKEEVDNSSVLGLPLEHNEMDILSSSFRKQERPYRKGMSYKRMKTDKSVCYD